MSVHRKWKCFKHRARKRLPVTWQLPVTPRYRGLLWISLLCVFMGFAYSPLSNVPAKLPLGLDVLTALLPAATMFWNPIWVFGGLWLLVGIVGVVTVMRRRKGEVVFAAQVAMLATWGIAYAMAFILGDPRAWVTAAIFLIFTGVTHSFTRVDPPLRFLWQRVRLRWTRS